MSSADPPAEISLDAPSLPQAAHAPIPLPVPPAPPILHPNELATPNLHPVEPAPPAVQSSPPPTAVGDVKVTQVATAPPAVPAAAPSTVSAAAPPPAASAAPIDKVPFRDLFQFATPEEMWLMRFSCFCAAGLGLVFPLFTILFGELLNSLNGARSLADVASDFSLKFLIIALCAGFGGSVSYGLPVYVAERQMKRVRELYLGSILRQEPAWFDVNKPGEVSSRLAEDTLTWQNGIADKFTQVFSNMVGFIASIIIGFNSNWKIALLVLGIFPAIMVIMIFLKVAIASGEKKASDAYAAAGDCSTEIFNSIRTVAAFCSEAAEAKKYLACLVKAKEASKTKGWSMGIAVGSLFFCIYAAYAAGMYLGGYLIRQDRLANVECDPYTPANAALGRSYVLPSSCVTGGSIIQTFMVVLTGAFLIGGAAPNFGTIASAQAAAFKIIEIIKRSPPIDVKSDEGLVPGRNGVPPLKGRIEFKNVRFSYPSRPDTVILDDFNLVIQPQQSVALVGPSGSGKSSIILLIQRFYDVQAGQILLDGRDIREYNVRFLRELIGTVSQEPQLFAISVKANISLGKPSSQGPASQEEITAAATAANAHKFIQNLQDGYDTLVGTSVSSTQLSGGQRQRLCIARCLIRRPKIMLFDEATSALDSESEVIVQRSIDELLKVKDRPTSVVVAHRLSTIVGCDCICVLQRGKLVESGTHSELMQNKDGLYFLLQQLQHLHHATPSTPSLSPSHSPPLDPATGSLPPPSLSLNSPPPAPLDDTLARERATSVASVSSASGSIEMTDVVGSAVVAVNQDPEFTSDASEGRVWRMQMERWYFIIIALVAALGAGVVSPCFAIIYSNVLQSFFRPSDVMESEAASYTGQFMAIACSILIATVLRIGLWYMLGEELTAKLRGLAFENLVRCEMAYFDVPEHSTGSLDTRLSADASLVKGATGEGLSQVFQCSSAIIAAVVIAMMASWRLGLIIVAAFPFLILATYFMNQTFTGFERNAKAALEASGHVAVEACTAIRTVTSLNLQPLMVEKFSEGMDERLKSGVKKAMSIAGGQAFAQFMTFALFSLAFYAGGRFMADGLLTFQNLLQVFFAIQMAAQTVASAQSFGPDRAKSKVALKSVFDIIDRPSRINPCDLSTGIRPSTFKGKIEFRNVCFAYPSRPERWVLRNFSMTIMPGQSCALVGESGCGKSSVILLILRFYEPQSGEILLDDVPIRQLNVRWLRENCALVQQEPALFADSIQYNIEYGRPADKKPEPGRGVPIDASVTGSTDGQGSDALPVPDDVIDAAKNANALSFIKEFKHSFMTHCGARGSQLSGGQRQRVAIARMLLRNATINLLDEATSALDSTSEKIVQESIDAMVAAHAGQRTTVIVAHRLSTVQKCDVIFVLSKGIVAESGTHDVLLKKKQLYWRLAHAQDTAV